MSRRAMTPSAQRLLTALGMPWVEVDGVLTDDLLGSSPGEVMWNGKTLFVDPGAEEWHVFHEAAHHVVCFQLRAGDLHKKNWGFEEDFGDTDRAVDEEARAAEFTVALLRKYRRPYLTAAWQMSLLESMKLPWRVYYLNDLTRHDKAKARAHAIYNYAHRLRPTWDAYKHLVDLVDRGEVP